MIIFLERITPSKSPGSTLSREAELRTPAVQKARQSRSTTSEIPHPTPAKASALLPPPSPANCELLSKAARSFLHEFVTICFIVIFATWIGCLFGAGLLIGKLIVSYLSLSP